MLILKERRNNFSFTALVFEKELASVSIVKVF